jgi:hypothetical protein
MNRLVLAALVSALPLAAGIVDVTDQLFAPVHSGATITVDFEVSTYGKNNPDVSPYPTGLDVNVLCEDPGSAEAKVPGSTARYYPGYLFQGWVESLDGAVSEPLYDPLAARLGFRPGTLLLTPGVFDAGGAPELAVGVISGTANLSSAQAEALFGSEFSARIILKNLGLPVVLGIGSDSVVRNAISEPDVRGFGPRSVAGITRIVTVSNPEPGTWMLTAGAAALLLIKVLRSRRGRERTPACWRA